MCTCGNCSTCKRRAYDRERYHSHAGRKEACAERVKKRRDRNRKYVADYLAEHPCVDCGEPDPIVLEFDHVRGVKLGNIATMVGSQGAFEKLVAEIEKCDVRCANCHRRKTHERGQWKGRPRSMPT